MMRQSLLSDVALSAGSTDPRRHRISLTQGVQMGKNDLWSAATAIASGATLITTDKDFDHLSPNHLDLVSVDPASTV